MTAAFSPPAFDAVSAGLGLSRNPGAVRARLVLLERILESAIRLPGNQRVGLDAFIGFVPIVGDLLSATIGTYLVWEARNLGMSRFACARMLARVGLDTAIGAIPVAGDLFDLVYRSNSRNLKRVLAHLDRQHPATAIVDGVKL